MLIIIIVPTVCAYRDEDNQLPSSAASTVAAAVVHMLCPSLIQWAATIIAKLKANPKTSDEAADLMEEVGACVSKYLVDGELGIVYWKSSSLIPAVGMVQLMKLIS